MCGERKVGFACLGVGKVGDDNGGERHGGGQGVPVVPRLRTGLDGVERQRNAHQHHMLRQVAQADPERRPVSGDEREENSKIRE